jgi:hypothetical protein
MAVFPPRSEVVDALLDGHGGDVEVEVVGQGVHARVHPAHGCPDVVPRAGVQADEAQPRVVAVAVEEGGSASVF